MELNKAVEKFLEACDKELKLSRENETGRTPTTWVSSATSCRTSPLEKIVSADINKYLSYLDDEQKYEGFDDAAARFKTLKAFFCTSPIKKSWPRPPLEGGSI
jgi:hypothetical protein